MLATDYKTLLQKETFKDETSFRISLPSFGYSSRIPFSSEIMVLIKQKRSTGVKIPPPRSSWCGICDMCDTCDVSVMSPTCHSVASREIETTVFDPASQFLSNISRRSYLLIYLGVHPNSSLQFLFASFYFPGRYCTHLALMICHGNPLILSAHLSYPTYHE